MKQGMKKEVSPVKPVTVRIEDFKYALNKAVADSELPPFMVEILLGEYLAGVSLVAKQEYEQGRAEWEKECGKNG